MKQSRTGKTGLLLAGLYFGSVAIRFLLALLTSAYPMTNIDEFLYYGMARSIATGQGLLFRGQPADYSYILYSLTLTPVYGLGLEGPILYRALELWNILLISLCVFPLYALARAFGGDEKKALKAAGLSLLLPDFIFGQVMMCENVIYPLFFAAVYFAYRYLTDRKLRDALLVGALGGLLFSAKPGAVAPAAMLLLSFLVLGAREKDKKQILFSIGGVGALVAVAAVFFLLVRALGGKISVLSIYQEQVAGSSHLDVFFKFLAVYPFYFILACGIGGVLVPLGRFARYPQAQKTLLLVLLLALAVTIMGIAWSVNRYEYNTNTAHLRYIGMFIPVMLLYTVFSPEGAAVPAKKQKAKKKYPLAAGIIVGYTVLCLIAMGYDAGATPSTVFTANMDLSVVIQLLRSRVPALPVALVLLIVCGLFLYLAGHEKKMKRAAILALICCMGVNNITTYAINRHDTRFDYASQAWELKQAAAGAQDELYLYTQPTTTSYYGAWDVYSPRDICFVSLNDLFNQIYAARGVYAPFLPEGQRGNIARRLTPDTDTLVMDATVYAMVKLSENTVHTCVNEDALHLVKILDRSKPWVDCIIGNTTNAILAAGDTGIILVFQEKYLQSPLTFRIKIQSEEGTAVTFFSSRETKTVQVAPGRKEYEITFDKPLDAYNFKAESGDIRLYGFDLINP